MKEQDKQEWNRFFQKRHELRLELERLLIKDTMNDNEREEWKHFFLKREQLKADLSELVGKNGEQFLRFFAKKTPKEFQDTLNAYYRWLRNA